MSMDMQALFDGLAARWQGERAETQVTLGKLIDFLQTVLPEKKVSGLGALDSYRGYYSDLAFEPSDKEKTVAELLGECKNAMGEVFHGYKGGEYQMGRNTPLWVANYGSSGPRLMGFEDKDGRLISITAEEDD